MPDPSRQAYTTFREAFCARFNCPSDQFVETVFWRALHRRALPLAWPIWLVNRNFFREDFALINAFGDAGTTREVTRATGEFGGSNRTGGGFLRRVLRVRVSGTRLTEIHNKLVSSMVADRPEKKAQPKPIASFATIRPASLGSASREAAPAGPANRFISNSPTTPVTRRCRSACEEILRGKPLAQVLSELGITEVDLMEHIESQSSDDAQMTWLGTCLKEHRRVEELARENEVLSRKVTNLTLEIDRLKEPTKQNP